MLRMHLHAFKALHALAQYKLQFGLMKIMVGSAAVRSARIRAATNQQGFTLSIVEIWGGRRSANQLSRWCHRQVHQQLLVKSAIMAAAPKIRKIYISQPIEGVAETTVTLRIGERVRSLILRFEGVDKRWLCTELVLL